MMGFSLIRYSGQESRIFQELEDRAIERDLTHYASWLLGRGLHSQAELEDALNKAMNTLGSTHLACYRHFKKIYISQQGQLKPDWLVSDLGMQMIIMHTNPGNPAMASLQVQLLTGSK